MDREIDRIQKLLEEGKISSNEAQNLRDALSKKPKKESNLSKPVKERKLTIVLLIGGLGIVTLILFSLLMDGKQQTKENLLLNPGFETGVGEKVSSWTASAAGLAFLGGPEKKDYFIRDDGIAHQGGFSVAIKNHERENEAQLSWRQRMKTFPIGEKLRLSGFIKTENVAEDGEAALVLRGIVGLNEEASSATTAMSYNLSGTSDWTKVQVEMRIDTAIESLQVLCQLKGLGTIWCDDLELTVLE